MKQFRFTVFALFAAMTLAFGLVVAQQQENEEAIEDAVRQYEERYNAGDIAGVAELFAEDAVLYDPFGGVYEGGDAIQQFYQDLFDAGFNEISIEIIEIEVLNDTAYEIASYTLTNDEGEAVEGYHMVVLTRENGKWRRHRVIANVAMSEEEMND